MTAVGVSLIMLIAACVQRVAGMGFSLVAVPLLLWILGPVNSVTLVNIASGMTSLVIIGTTFRDISWQHVLRLAIPALVITVPSAYILTIASSPWIELLVGILLLACCCAMSFNLRIRLHRSVAVESVSGFISGFMNTTAGVAGPAVSAYAFSAGWPHRMFVATLQPYFLLVDAGAVAAKYSMFNASGHHSPGAVVAIPALIGCVAGLIVGRQVAMCLSSRTSRRVVVAIAVLGSLVTTGRALVALTT
ncbi:sulfite exporter TauE/SafE family protein [Spelaeicoccus albus]|uniref:Probable membrane transporter protein n=1 Tax=Spelaeicoccus albus TaxID=1280376 RepID=A0A7Z0D4K4_9MICO|nr:sulfite exporter TauE/SafE family protein [Spelaeicoccus albus]NYI68777.1 hypothetical protein [Spelaeicoccus albus]